MNEDKILEVLERLDRGQQGLVAGQQSLERGQQTLERGQEALQRGLHAVEARQDSFDAGLQALERGLQDHRRETLDMRTAIMTKLERVDNKLEALSTGLAHNVTQVGGILDQLSARESQLALLQDAIRAGINSESLQVRAVQRTLASMNSIVLTMQNQIADLTQRVDEQRPREAPSPGH